ncbi:MAG: OmpH family outer membrane protein [Deltaproteobacteria bacterium]|nr:OmpH family outer membrane protein [Deltaproteobacteria bacterium]
MKRLCLKTALAVMTLVLACTLTHAAEKPKIAVVDMQNFQRKSTAFQKLRAELQKQFQAMQKKLDQEKESLVKLEEDLKKQSMMLSLDAQENKRNELEKKRRYYKYLYEDFTQEMKDIETEATKKVTKELAKVVQKIGEKEGYVLIFERRTIGLLYAHDSTDITDQVVEIYDRSKP